jgi:type IV pilus assembly protein PilM
MPNTAWGIDLGNRALKAVKLVREGDRLRVDDFEVIEHEQILSTTGDNKESMLQSALANFLSRRVVKGVPVGVAVAGQQSFARFIKLPPVEPRKIPEIVRFEAIQQIPFPLDDVEWAFQLFTEKDSPDVEVGIFAIKKDLVNRQIGYLTNLGLNVQVVQMHPLAVYNAMHHDGRVGDCTMFMDSGAENTDLVIADGNTVWLRTLSIGGNTFTEMLGKAFKLSFQKAEELKRNAATSKYAKQIFQAMRPVFADLVADIQRSIGFYASVHRDARISRIVALGSTFQLPGLQKYLQQNLSLPVEKIDSYKLLPPVEPRLAAGFSENQIALAGAYGLAVQALGDARITSSLLPAAIRREKMWREKTKWFMAAAATFVIGTSLAGTRLYYDQFMYDHRDAVKRDPPAGYLATIELAERQARQWRSEVENKGEEDRVRLLNVRSLMDYRDTWPNILADVFAAVPPADLQKLQSTPRKQRQQIQIRSILPQVYEADLKDVLAGGSDLSRYAVRDAAGVNAMMRPVQPPPPPPIMGDDGTALVVDVPKPQRGFVVTIRGTTPNAGGAKYVHDAFLRNLLTRTAAAQARDGRNWYVARAEVVAAGPPDVQPRRTAAGGFNTTAAGGPDAPDFTGGQELTIAAAPDRRGPAGVPSGRGPGFRRPGGDAAGPNLQEQARLEMEEASRDRYFPNEKIVEDWDFTAVVVIVLDPQQAIDDQKKARPAD